MWLYLFVDATRGQRVLWVRIKRDDTESDTFLLPIKLIGADSLRANDLLQTGRLKNGKIAYYGSSFLISLGNLEKCYLKSDFSKADIVEVSHTKTNRFENLSASMIAHTKNLAQVVFSDYLMQLELYDKDLDDPKLSPGRLTVLASGVNLNINDTFVDMVARKHSIDCGPIGSVVLEDNHIFTKQFEQIGTLMYERELRLNRMIDFTTFIQQVKSGKVELV